MPNKTMIINMLATMPQADSLASVMRRFLGKLGVNTLPSLLYIGLNLKYIFITRTNHTIGYGRVGWFFLYHIRT